eukprot:6312823-Prymnesium_polylepis.1
MRRHTFEEVGEAIGRLERLLPLLAQPRISREPHLVTDALVAKEFDPRCRAAALRPRLRAARGALVCGRAAALRPRLDRRTILHAQ